MTRVVQGSLHWGGDMSAPGHASVWLKGRNQPAPCNTPSVSGRPGGVWLWHRITLCCALVGVSLDCGCWLWYTRQQVRPSGRPGWFAFVWGDCVTCFLAVSVRVGKAGTRALFSRRHTEGTKAAGSCDAWFCFVQVECQPVQGHSVLCACWEGGFIAACTQWAAPLLALCPVHACS